MISWFVHILCKNAWHSCLRSCKPEGVDAFACPPTASIPRLHSQPRRGSRRHREKVCTLTLSQVRAGCERAVTSGS